MCFLQLRPAPTTLTTTILTGLDERIRPKRGKRASEKQSVRLAILDVESVWLKSVVVVVVTLDSVHKMEVVVVVLRSHFGSRLLSCANLSWVCSLSVLALGAALSNPLASAGAH